MNERREEEVELYHNCSLMKKLSFILNGPNRMKIYLALTEGIKTARELESDLKVSLTSICRTLKDLTENEVILCVNSFEYRGKLYRLADDVIKLRYIIEKKTKRKKINI